jgi:WXG100 family type VII secretion target
MADGNWLSAVTETLETTATRAVTHADSIAAHQAALRPTVDALKGQWDGTAPPLFEAAHARWEEGIVRLTTALRDLGDNTRFSSNTYAAADQSGATALNAVQDHSPFGGLLRQV